MIDTLLKNNLGSAREFWTKIVGMGGQAEDRESMADLADYLKTMFISLGMDCKSIPVGGNYPPILKGDLPGKISGKPVLFTGHYDTVFPFDTYPNLAFRIENGVARGPGVLDMKGGIAVAWLVIKTLTELDIDHPPIRILFAGDEETIREGSDTIHLIKEHGAGCQYGFNMETGIIDQSVCIGRKGVEEFVVNIKGIASHPGNFFDKGRNAIEEAANKIILMQRLTADDLSYTVNVGTIQSGGTMSNIIPDSCTFKIDLRFQSEKDRKYLQGEIEKICKMQFVKDTTTEVYSTGILPPFETHPKEEALYGFLAEVARDNGLTVPGKKVLGGASDAAFIAETDTPILCAMGVCGEYNHSLDEYADINSFEHRAKLLIHAVLEYKKFKL